MKGKKFQEGNVVDEKGRRRFHGAFTGGFSAGYYNTVGSEEGWKPTQFISSRNNRAQPITQSMYNFMDNEDGLLGEVLITKEDFDTFGKHLNDKKEKYLLNESYSSAIPGPIPSEMIVSSSKGIGLKLLKQMGWKDGQGIGSRRKRKTRDDKTIGIEVHNGIDLSQLPVGAIVNGEILLSALDDEPNKLAQIPKPKTDKYGLGFYNLTERYSNHNSQDLTVYNKYNSDLMIDTNIGSGIYRVDDINQISSSETFNNNLAVGKINNKIVRDIGGFALDDDEDDVYDNPNTSIDYTKVSTYTQPITKLHSELNLSLQNDDKFSLLLTSDSNSNLNSNSNSNSLIINNNNITTQLRCKTDNKLPLLGFHVSTHTLHCTLIKSSQSTLSQSNKDDSNIFVFLPPTVPQNFIEKHNFENDRYLINKQNNNNINNNNNNSENKSENKNNNNFEKQEKQNQKINNLLTNNSTSTLFSIPTPIAQGLATALKGRFTSSSSSTTTTSLPSSSSLAIQPQGGLVTSLELQQERKLREEHEKRLIQDDNKKIQLNPNKGSRRITTTWAPNRLLCKRMNVPVPQITSENMTVSTQIINHGREAEIFEKHIEKHMAPFINPNTSSFEQQQLQEEEGQKGQQGQDIGNNKNKINHQKSEENISKKSFQLEENIDPITGIFIPEVKPTMSLLKSIFDDSDSDDSSSDNDNDNDNDSDKSEENNEEKDDKNDKDDKNIEISNNSEISNQKKNESLDNNQTLSKINENENNITENDSRIVFRKPVSKISTSLKSNINNNIPSNPKKRSFNLSFSDDNNDNDNNNDNNNNKEEEKKEDKSVVMRTGINIDKKVKNQIKNNDNMNNKQIVMNEIKEIKKEGNSSQIDSVQSNQNNDNYTEKQEIKERILYPKEMRLDASNAIDRLKRSLELVEGEKNSGYEKSKKSKQSKERKHKDEKKKKKEKKSKKKSKKESKKKKSKRSSSISSSSSSITSSSS